MSYLDFKGVNDYGDFTITDELQYGLQTYFEWGFLNIGAFTNVRHIGSNAQYTFSLDGVPNLGQGTLTLGGTGILFDYSNLNGQILSTTFNSWGDDAPTITYPHPASAVFTFDNNNVGIPVELTYSDDSSNPWRTVDGSTATIDVTQAGDAMAGQETIFDIVLPIANAYGTFTLSGYGAIQTWNGYPVSYFDGTITWNKQGTTSTRITYKSSSAGAFVTPTISDSQFGLDLTETLTQNNPGGIPTTGEYYENEHKLRPVPNPNYTTTRVWEGFRNNWVWESGISYAVQPIEISGIYVNNTFQPTTGVGTYAFDIDYPNGRVIFDSAISATSTVLCEYSYKRIKFTNSDSVEGRQLHERTLDIDNQFMIYSGEKVEFDRNKLQLPVVAIEAIPRKRFPRGTQLGGGHYLEQSFLFHVFAETPQERNKILDIIVHQHDSSIVVYDMNKLAEDNMYPLNLDGNIVNQSTRNYNNLVGVGSQYGYRQGIFKSIESQEQNVLASNLFGGIAKVVVEVGIPNV